MTTMTREELSTMTKAELAKMTAFAGNLKNTKKETLIDRALELMLELMAAETTENAETEKEETEMTENTKNAETVTAENTKEEENVMTTETTKTATAETETKKRTRKTTKKSFEELVALIPMIANVRYRRVLKGAVAVRLGEMKKDLFILDNKRIVTKLDICQGLTYEESQYGNRLEVTAENMLRMIQNARKALAEAAKAAETTETATAETATGEGK